MSPIELRSFLREELRRWDSREQALWRTGGFGHVARILSLLTFALREVEDAGAALLDNIERQDRCDAVRGSELFREGGRLSVVVHLRVDAFCALARMLLDRTALAIERYLGPVEGFRLTTHCELHENLAAFVRRKGLQDVPPSLSAAAERLTAEVFAERDLHVRIGNGAGILTASVWSSSGDAAIAPGPGPQNAVTLREVLDLLEQYVAQALDYLGANRDQVSPVLDAP